MVTEAGYETSPPRQGVAAISRPCSLLLNPGSLFCSLSSETYFSASWRSLPFALRSAALGPTQPANMPAERRDITCASRFFITIPFCCVVVFARLTISKPYSHFGDNFKAVLRSRPLPLTAGVTVSKTTPPLPARRTKAKRPNQSPTTLPPQNRRAERTLPCSARF